MSNDRYDDAAMEREPKVDPQQVELERPQRENEEMQEQLRRAETIIEIQKKW